MIVSAQSIQRAGEILRSIEELQAELAGLFGNSNAGADAPKRRGRPPGTGGKRGGNMSAEGRARIAAAAKARWARFHAEKAKAAKKGS